MMKREKYLNKLTDAKDTEFIKAISGIRGCGKTSLLLMFRDYLLENGVSSNHIIYINFESSKFEDISDYKKLVKFIKEKIKKGRYYLLLDEVQVVEKWEKGVNGINVDFDVDIYITGSNAYLLSSELSTLLAGRYIEIKMYPLSFREFLVFNDYDESSIDEKFNEYVLYGGLPAISTIRDNKEMIESYLEGIYNTIVKKDIIDRNNINNVALLENIIKYICSNVGSPISPNKISNYLNSNKIALNCNHQTIDNYLKMLENSFIVYKAGRSDVRSKAILKTLGKYYLADTGIRNYIMGFRNIDEGHLLENVVYLELLRRGYRVSVGRCLDYEVDFVAENFDEVVYYQVCRSITSDDVLKRELRSLESISDNYAKVILTMDKPLVLDYNGIKCVNVIDFLLEKKY